MNKILFSGEITLTFADADMMNQNIFLQGENFALHINHVDDDENCTSNVHVHETLEMLPETKKICEEYVKNCRFDIENHFKTSTFNGVIITGSEVSRDAKEIFPECEPRNQFDNSGKIHHLFVYNLDKGILVAYAKINTNCSDDMEYDADGIRARNFSYDY